MFLEKTCEITLEAVHLKFVFLNLKILGMQQLFL